MKKIFKLKYCLFGNIFILFLILMAVFFYKEKSPYWNVGPNDNLQVMYLKIDNLLKYIGLLFFIIIINIGKAYSDEIAMPIIYFNVYNPDKRIISEFTKFQLQFYSNSLYVINSIRKIFIIMFIISQIDIALFSVFVSTLAQIYTKNLLLEEKRFSEQLLNDADILYTPINLL
jgi:hypothetical protein